MTRPYCANPARKARMQVNFSLAQLADDRFRGVLPYRHSDLLSYSPRLTFRLDRISGVRSPHPARRQGRQNGWSSRPTHPLLKNATAPSDNPANLKNPLSGIDTEHANIAHGGFPSVRDFSACRQR